MKYFISQPMNGRTDAEIKEERERIVKGIKKEDPEAVIIDSFLEGAPHDAKPLWFLGKSFELLSGADMALFPCGVLPRGCRMEREACELYGINFNYYGSADGGN